MKASIASASTCCPPSGVAGSRGRENATSASEKAAATAESVAMTWHENAWRTREGACVGRSAGRVDVQWPVSAQVSASRGMRT